MPSPATPDDLREHRLPLVCSRVRRIARGAREPLDQWHGSRYRQLRRSGGNVRPMGNAKAGEWRYTARYGWDWRSARAISKALGSLALPMPPWFRAVVARGLLTRTALHADAQGIWGSAGPLPAGPTGPCPCPWKDVTNIVVWNYDHLRIIGIARRGDEVF